jgi:hypothetical protein
MEARPWIIQVPTDYLFFPPVDVCTVTVLLAADTFPAASYADTE